MTPYNDLIVELRGSRAWVRYAACRGMDPNLFFGRMRPLGRLVVKNSATVPRVEKVPPEAAEVCARCAVRDACLEYVLANSDQKWAQMGVWGGKTPSERRRIVLERERAHVG